MTEIVMVRHGETDSNVRGTYLGWTDVSLNQKGLKQASDAREKLMGESFDICIASPLKRAFDTANIILEGKATEIIREERLKERNFGIWDDLTYKEILERFPDKHAKWIVDLNNYAIEDGESFKDSYDRAAKFIDNLLMEHSHKKILIVTHAGCIKKILAYLTGMGVDGAWRFMVDNATVNRIIVNDEGFAYITAINA